MRLHHHTRRNFVRQTALVGAGIVVGADRSLFANQVHADQVKVLNPKDQVPISFIIDDSTALVNLAYFGIPQFQEVFPDQYQQDWRKLPREIPDDFVREFRDYCQEHGVKGKYSIVPYPACSGWVDRFIPGWSKKELQESLKLVRETMQPDWDIHPEMISHTRVIDIKTGRPFPEADAQFMENWGWSQDKSADELGDYLAYALRVLKNAGLTCEGITTPGGFGGENKENLAQGTLAAVREVYGKVDVAHYFRDLYTEPTESVVPLVKYPADLHSNDPKCVVSVIGCTGDWFGGWDGLTPGSADKFITADLSQGRMVEVIDRGEPAMMVCHWPGIYYNGEKIGFNIFKQVVSRLEQKYGTLNWMKNSEIARYWAAKELTEIKYDGKKVSFYAPFAGDNFTLQVNTRAAGQPMLQSNGQSLRLEKVASKQKLKASCYYQQDTDMVVCLDLQTGNSELVLS
ncbi:MAG: twin-arginine translocation signal domain-containing protein [Cyclobacteriaceae bacterium]